MYKSSVCSAQPLGSAGAGTSCKGENAQCGLLLTIGAVEASGHLAPAAIQAFKSATTCGGSACLGGICTNSFSSCLMAIESRLPSASPGVTAGPLSPPLNTPSRVSSRKPPLALVGPWHSTQLAASTGRTFDSKKLSGSLRTSCPLARKVHNAQRAKTSTVLCDMSIDLRLPADFRGVLPTLILISDHSDGQRSRFF